MSPCRRRSSVPSRATSADSSRSLARLESARWRSLSTSCALVEGVSVAAPATTARSSGTAIWMRRRSMRQEGADASGLPVRTVGSSMQVRLLVLADRPPPGDVLGWVRGNDPDLVVLCGDLDLAWIDDLREVDLPKLGVYGNHDGAHMAALGITDLHLRRAEIGGVSLAGFEGCVRYRRGRISTRRRRRPSSPTRRRASRACASGFAPTSR